MAGYDGPARKLGGTLLQMPSQPTTATAIRRTSIEKSFDAFAQRREGLFGGTAIDAHTVLAQPTGAGQFKFTFDTAVIGQKQQTFGIQVETPDGHDTRQVFRQVLYV